MENVMLINPFHEISRILKSYFFGEIFLSYTKHEILNLEACRSCKRPQAQGLNKGSETQVVIKVAGNDQQSHVKNEHHRDENSQRCIV